jgi:hypothetical protein
MCALSLTLLLVSLGLLFGSAGHREGLGMEVLFPMQLLVILDLIAAAFRARRLKGEAPSLVGTLRLALPPWTWAAALILAVLTWTLGPKPAFALGTTPDGRRITGEQWHESGGHYFVRINGGQEMEVPREQYESMQRELFGMFSRIWVIGSFIAIILWRYVGIREQVALNPAGPGETWTGGPSPGTFLRRIDDALSGPGGSRGWVWVRIALVVAGGISGLSFTSAETAASSNLGWSACPILLLACPIMILFVVGLQAVNRRSAPVWRRPSWSLNPFQPKEPLQFFHLGAFHFIAGGMVGLAAALFRGPTGVPLAVSLIAIGCGTWLGVRLCMVVFRRKMQTA